MDLGALDYREQTGKTFKARPCKLCLYRDPDNVQIITSPEYIPDTIKLIFDVDYICGYCRKIINWRVTHYLRLCWSEITVEAEFLACMMVLNNWLKTLSFKDVWHKRIITKSINKGEKLPEWAYLDYSDRIPENYVSQEHNK